jgi:hypothetical protein
VSTVETKLTLFQMQLDVAPKRLNTIDMPAAAHKLVVAMINPKVLVKAHVHQAVIAAPAIGVNDAVGIDLAPDNRLQRGFAGIVVAGRVFADAAKYKDNAYAVGGRPLMASPDTSPNPILAKDKVQSLRSPAP